MSSQQRVLSLRYDKFKRQLGLQSMVLPSLALVILFVYFPMYGLIMAFQDFQLGDVPGFSTWVGLEHFRVLFSDPNLYRITRNTIAMSGLKLLFAFPAPILLALLLNELPYRGFKRVLQTVTYMPHFLSWVVVAAMMFEFLSGDSGIVNHVLIKAGIIDSPIVFMGEAQYFWPLVVGSEIWKETGWSAIIYLAAISGIDPAQYEAAEIDGANRLQRIWHIVIPGIMPTIMILFILSVSRLLDANFDQVMMMTGNLNNRAVAETADVIDTFIFSYGIRLGRFSFATAATFLKSAIGATLLILANKMSRVLNQESLW